MAASNMASVSTLRWDSELQGYVLGSFFIGYLIMHIPASHVAKRFGGRKMIIINLLLLAVTNALIPLSKRIFRDEISHHSAAYYAIAMRTLSGMECGMFLPAAYYLWGRWIPSFERSKHISLGLSGGTVGIIVVFAFGGTFCEFESFGGWASSFYLGSIACLLCSVLFYFTIYDSPLHHPRICEREKRFLMEHVHISDTDVTVPWKSIVTSKAVWACWLAHLLHSCSDYSYATKLPAYIDQVLHFNAKQNGLILTLPYIVSAMVANLSAKIADKLHMSKFKVRLVVIRKWMTCLDLCGASIPLIAMGFVPENLTEVAVVLLVTAVGMTGFARPGFFSNIADIAPTYSGQIFAVSNTLASVPGLAGPPIINAITKDGTRLLWRIVFFMLAGLNVTGAVIFTLLARGDKQKWEPGSDDHQSRLENSGGVDNIALERQY